MTIASYERLERLLGELTETHERMLEAVRLHRAALAKADLKGMSAAIATQGDLARRIGLLEQERAAVVAQLAEPRPPSSTTSRTNTPAPEVRLSGLIAAAPSPNRARLEGLRLLLKDVLERLSAEQRSLKDAATTLAGHVEGVIRQIHERVAHAGTYVRSGRIDTSVRVVSALDIRS